MALEINKPKIVANRQVIEFHELRIIKSDGKLSAEVTFIVSNEDGQRVDTIVRQYAGDDYNRFWVDFNSGTFLYSDLAKANSFPVPAPKSHENEFINPIA